MSNDPWGLFEDETKARIKYAEHFPYVEDNGNWQKITITLTPIEPDKEVKEHKFFSFLPSWRKICKASTLEIVMALPKERRPEFASKVATEKSWIKYYWEEYRDYDKQVVAKKKADGYDNQVNLDEHGEYIKYLGIHYVQFFFDENEWRQDYEQNKNGEEVETKPITNDPAIQAAKAAIPGLLDVCGTDMARFQTFLANPPLNIFTMDSPEIKSAVAKKVALACGTDIPKQDAMLAEINAHFTEPYLELDSPELLAELTEIAF